MMTGKGQLGPLLAAIGMKPVVFQSEADFTKSITTESKVFSIYAVGVKSGYRRETRVKVHAVVDFRNAPGLDTMTGSLTGQAGVAGANALPNATNPALGTATQSQGAITAATQPSTGGQIVYYRVE